MKTEVIRILLIEDSHNTARLVREDLKEIHGDKFKLECEGRLSKGLERIGNGKFDVILLDLSLPALVETSL